LALLLVATLLFTSLRSPSRRVSLVASQPKVGAVFYSGEGCAGLAQAAAALRRLRAQWLPCVPGFFGGTGVYDGRWTSDTPCDTSKATFPSVIGGTTISQLVGYSLGRLGPLYFLN